MLDYFPLILQKIFHLQILENISSVNFKKHLNFFLKIFELYLSLKYLISVLRLRDWAKNLLHHCKMFSVVMCLEQGETKIELKRNAPNAPDVAWLTPTQFKDNFRSSVMAGAHHLGMMFPVKSCWSEVNQTHLGVLHFPDIFPLQKGRTFYVLTFKEDNKKMTKKFTQCPSYLKKLRTTLILQKFQPLFGVNNPTIKNVCFFTQNLLSPHPIARTMCEVFFSFFGGFPYGFYHRYSLLTTKQDDVSIIFLFSPIILAKILLACQKINDEKFGKTFKIRVLPFLHCMKFPNQTSRTKYFPVSNPCESVWNFFG